MDILINLFHFNFHLFKHCLTEAGTSALCCMNMAQKTQLRPFVLGYVYLAVDSQHQQHGEKQYGPEWRDGQLGHGLRISQKC